MRRGDEVEAARVKNRPAAANALADTPLGLAMAVTAQPARVVEVRAHTRVVDGTKASEETRRPIGERFAAFDAEHPNVWSVIESLALAEIASGATRLGFKYLVETARRRLRLAINNDFTSEFSRKFLAKYPQHRALVETRDLKRSA
jgi:hypothetical protein